MVIRWYAAEDGAGGRALRRLAMAAPPAGKSSDVYPRDQRGR